jgi:hypothetical protein
LRTDLAIGVLLSEQLILVSLVCAADAGWSTSKRPGLHAQRADTGSELRDLHSPIDVGTS